MNTFLPPDYTPPASNSGYLKFQKGKNKFRFLSSPITGWVYFVKGDDGKTYVHRVKPTEDAPEAHLKAKHFWSAVVFDYATKSVKILEITQKTIQGGIMSLIQDESWGSPLEYDICITKTGDGMETEYQVVPQPKTEVPKEILKEAKKINLEALYEGKDPFTE